MFGTYIQFAWTMVNDDIRRTYKMEIVSIVARTNSVGIIFPIYCAQQCIPTKFCLEIM